MKPLEFERITVEDVQRLMADQARPTSPEHRHHEREQAPPEPIADATIAWIARLPPLMRPMELARQFPRVANRICELWKRPSQCDVYMRELIMSKRGDRRGFPPEVAKEISDLADHYVTLFPYRHSIWDEVLRK
jgi:hypothetical protein